MVEALDTELFGALAAIPPHVAARLWAQRNSPGYRHATLSLARRSFGWGGEHADAPPAGLPAYPAPWSPLPAADRGPPRRELVVAHYRADLAWLADVPAAVDRITVYTKGPECVVPPDPRITVMPRPNAGREAETIASHVAACHGSLADLTLFAQDSPRDHAPDFLARLAPPYDAPTTLTTRYLPGVPAGWITARDKVEAVHGLEVRYGDARVNGHGDGSDARPWFDTRAWDHVFEGECPDPLWFGYSAQWAVPRANLLARPRGFWAWHAGQIVAGEASRPNSSRDTDPPANPWSAEALWRYVFDPATPIRWREGELPGALAMAGNLARAIGRTAKAAAAGEALAADGATYRARLAACKGCPEWRASDERCSRCGCYTATKLRLAAERCPLDPPRWEAVR
jgi:hypothetical protein